MRKAYLAIITIITIFCIIIGSYRNLIYQRNEYDESEYAEETAEEFEEIPASEHTWEFPEDITAVEVDLEVGNVCILEGTNMIELQDPDFIEHEINDGVLRVRQNPGYKKHLKNEDDHYDLSEDMADVWIYLPESNPPDNISVSIRAGAFTMSGIKPPHIDISCDLGDVRIDNVSFNEGQVSAKMGNITLDAIAFENLTVNEEMGNIYIYSTNDLTGYEKDCSVKLGVLTMNGSNIGRSVRSEGTDGKLVVTNDMGDIEINWSF